MKKILFLIPIIFCLTSCEDFFSSTLEVDPPKHEDQMVLHAYIGDTDSILAISVTQSFGILENTNSDQYIDDAVIGIYESGQLQFTFEPLSQGNRPLNYLKELPAAFSGVGKTFEIIATHPRFGEARASQTMPAAVPVQSVKFKENAGVEEGERVDGIEITFKDPLGVDNFYEFAVYSFDQQMENSYSTWTTSNDPLVRESVQDAGWLLSDETFDGKEYKLTLLRSSSFDNNMYLVVNSITEEWYRYSKSVRDQINAEDFGLFSEPVSLSTNVSGGLGIFGLRTERVYPIQF